MTRCRFPVLRFDRRLKGRQRSLIRHEHVETRRHAQSLTLSSLTWFTRSDASLILRISSSKDCTRPPTRSAVLAVGATFRERELACVDNSSSCGTRAWRRLKEERRRLISWSTTVLADRRFDNDADISASSDWYAAREESICGTEVSVRGSCILVENTRWTCDNYVVAWHIYLYFQPFFAHDLQRPLCSA